VFRLYLYARVRFFALIAHETAGAACTRHSLLPPFLRDKVQANLGRSVPREGEIVSTVIASGAKQSLPQQAAKWIASRSLSSGAHSRDPLARNDADGPRQALFARNGATNRPSPYASLAFAIWITVYGCAIISPTG
jgi:hypothetical protein